MSEEQTKEAPAAEETAAQETKPMSFEDGVIKVDLSELNKPVEDAIPEQEADASDVPVEQPQDTPSSEEVVEEVREPVQNEESVLQEITEEEVQEQV
jgi:predicted transcriptional regulator